MDSRGPIASVTGAPHPSAGSRAKRLMDVVSAVALLLLASPVLLLAASAVLVSSGRPLVFRRRCVGLGGKEFDAYKLRTMRADAEAVLASDAGMRAEFEKRFKLARDPRITGVGRVLRRWSIDELPQLVNVLRGEMSLVGPRMITRPELEKYGSHARELLRVRPGLTGLWQVSGRQQVSYEERIALDLRYLETWSVLEDVAIMLRTPIAVVAARGAH